MKYQDIIKLVEGGSFNIGSLLVCFTEELTPLEHSTLGVQIFKGEDYIVKLATDEVGIKQNEKELQVFTTHPSLALGIIFSSPIVQIYENCEMFESEEQLNESFPPSIYDYVSNHLEYNDFILDSDLDFAEQTHFNNLCVVDGTLKFFQYSLDTTMEDIFDSYFSEDS